MNKLISITRLINATRYSVSGLKTAWKSETAFRQEVWLAAFMIPGGFWLGTTLTQRILLIGSCLTVIITELLNSAIEAVVDKAGKEYHVLSKKAKDLGSAAVFVSLIFVIVTWGLIIYDRFS